MHPASKHPAEVDAFLAEHTEWLLAQLRRVERLGGVWLERRNPRWSIPLRGESRAVVLERGGTGRHSLVVDDGQAVQIKLAPAASSDPALVLERWLRQQARRDIQEHIAALGPRLGQWPKRLFIMDQRTKWGNCAGTGNLSFSWRLVMAPTYVLQYLVTHEMVHLVVPDHSARFWLTVQSHCKESERSRRWLAANGQALHFDLAKRLKQE